MISGSEPKSIIPSKVLVKKLSILPNSHLVLGIKIGFVARIFVPNTLWKFCIGDSLYFYRLINTVTGIFILKCFSYVFNFLVSSDVLCMLATQPFIPGSSYLPTFFILIIDSL